MTPSITRRGLLKAGLVTAAGLALYSGELERHWIELKEIDIALRNLPGAFHGFRIVQLSDIHLEGYTEHFFLHHAVNRINDLKPDAVVLTGDFVSDGPFSNRHSLRAASHCAEILSALTCPLRFGVLGNHDVAVGSSEILHALTSRGIAMLDNASIPLDHRGECLWIAGIDDPVNGHPDPDRAIPKAIHDQPVILLCHAPDFADPLHTLPAGDSVSLMLSGHTHGGQVRIPFVGPLNLPALGRKYIEGHFRLGQMQLYVNRGLGTVAVPFRFNCPPEITLITLRRA